MGNNRWIFIRGLGRHSGHWGSFIEEFRSCFPQAEIELLDLRGNGSLEHSPSCLSIADNVRDLRSRSAFVREGQPAYLMTISLASMVGVEWSRLHPEEISGLVCINTSDRGTSRFYERLRPRNLKSLLKVLFSGKMILSSALEKEILEMTTNTMPRSTEWVEKFSKMKSTSASNLFRQLVAAGTYQFPRQKPKTEILMLCSAADHLVNPLCSERIAAMWTLKAHTHPTAGHDIPLEDPKWVCGELKNWLA